ncbi:hypothetical protein CEUSTIGMA_g12307.t1 [Chlamydomonas eustigma]|uniref:Uncharacterized protein n=1 Tax=Chlamydomonas eustigma TaxID=1157962 RepID=A0A250XPB1_9CHLO|nr:hypothetical protein CEUSTIGMA_g12307.t1 [Chlamydomonas eustigma]|eukprot:GAX84886.1 hypothetical protein CEUSTIGMA_g12307.t1 [Chlamydomonas eustigma]
MSVSESMYNDENWSPTLLNQLTKEAKTKGRFTYYNPQPHTTSPALRQQDMSQRMVLKEASSSYSRIRKKRDSVRSDCCNVFRPPLPRTQAIAISNCSQTRLHGSTDARYRKGIFPCPSGSAHGATHSVVPHGGHCRTHSALLSAGGPC